MRESPSEALAREALTGMGLRVTRIAPDQKHPRCDYSAFDSDASYVIEVKDKENSKAFKELQRQLLAAGRAEVTAGVMRENVLCSVFRDAERQLNATARADDLRLVWFSCLGSDASLVISQAEVTLYGVREVMPFGPGWRQYPTTRPAYYFGLNEFHRLKGIDAAMLSYSDRGYLCLNTHSPRYAKLRSTGLVSRLGEAVCDPLDLERRDCAFVVDGDVDRRSEGAVQAYITKKYGLCGVSAMVEMEAKFALRLPRSNPS